MLQLEYQCDVDVMEGKAFNIIQDAWQHQFPLQWLAWVHACWLTRQTMMAVQMGCHLGLLTDVCGSQGRRCGRGA